MVQVCEDYDADIIFFFGPVERPKDDFLIDECIKKRRRKNVILFIATFGGNADAAYRIARTLQNNYKDGKFYAFVPSVCASAGTLLVMGADVLILTDHAELGPIDVQLVKTDEIGERTSGLTPIHALEYLRDEANTLFERQFARLRFIRRFSTNVAAKIATEITTGLMSNLYEQIDPIRVAEVNRSLRVAHDYGTRIARNLKQGALEQLLSNYKAHDFVIDPNEARELFETIEEPKVALKALEIVMKPYIKEYLYGEVPQVTYFEEPKEEEPKQKQTNYENKTNTSSEAKSKSTASNPSSGAKRRKSNPDKE